MLFMLANYEMGTNFRHLASDPFGVIERSGDVTASYLSTVHIVVWEQNNMYVTTKMSKSSNSASLYDDTVAVGSDLDFRI